MGNITDDELYEAELSWEDADYVYNRINQIRTKTYKEELEKRLNETKAEQVITNPLTNVVKSCSEIISLSCDIATFGWFNYPTTDTINIDLLKRKMSDAVESFEELEKYIKEVNYKRNLTEGEQK